MLSVDALAAADSRDWQQQEISDDKKYLQAVAGRYLYKARFSRFHLERGTYPKYDKVDIDAARPFGEARDNHFKELTSEGKVASGASPSQWRQWVRKEYWSTLKAYIVEKNDIENRHDVEAKSFDSLFERYLRGELSL